MNGTNPTHDAPPEAFYLTAPMRFEAQTITAADDAGGPKLPRFSMVAYTGGPMRLAGWRHPVIVDLAGLAIPSQTRPIRVGHDTDKRVGHTDVIRIDGGRLIAEGVVSCTGSAARDVVADARNGFPWQASIGASVEQYEFVKEGQIVAVNGREFAGPAYVVRRSTLGEISFVDLGADGNTSAQVAASANKENSIMDDKNTSDQGTDAVKGDARNNATGMEAGGAAPVEVTTDPIAQMRAKASAETLRIDTIRKVCAGIVAAGLALVTLGYAIVVLSKVLGILATVVTGVGMALKLFGAVLAFLVTPIGLVIAAVVALGAYILYATDAGAKALGWLGERFDSLRDEAVASYQGIADALAAGDIALAAKILWLTLKMEWTKGINFLEKAWLNFRNFFIRIGYDAWHGLLAVVEIVWHALEIGWIETTAFLSRTWAQFTGWVTKAWHWCGKQLAKAWNWIRKQFDSSFDADAANRAADEYYEAKKSEIEQETGRKLAEREEHRQQERERTTQVHETTMAEIGRQNLQKHQELDNEYQQRMAENEADLAKARREWQDSLAEARRKRQAKEAEGPGKMEGPEDLLAKVRGSLSGLGDLLQGARERTVGVAGTFNAAALLGLQAGGVDERIAAATERTAKGVEGLRQDVKNNQAVFV